MTAVVWHVDRKPAVPWAAPWRMLAPKLFAAGPAVLFALLIPLAILRVPTAVLWAMFFTCLGGPWVSAVLITVEWLRRRAEDRATGVVRPAPPWI